ncbi:MAG TPA: glycerol kinase GlpK, partial [Aestuariivirga sp.]|nr:glycerol kinase GlpK [Aestuariivirga sp.]
MPDFILAIDQGTTSSRAIVFDTKLRPKASAQKEFKQYFPNSGWVEHDPEEIWKSVLATCKSAIAKAKTSPKNIRAIGITNQRETTVVWDRKTGKAIHKAIVWQDRRTAEICAGLKVQGHEDLFRERTGLLLDPYFSGTKVSWILDHVKGARERAERGELCFGTIDSFLIWRLTGGKAHVTDATNASRTLLYNIHNGAWDGELLNILRVPRVMLPEVKDCAADFGVCDAKLLGAAIPISGVAGDQQAATIGQACFEPGMMKSTYGTGCFALLNTGSKAVVSNNRLLTTVAYQLDGKRTYALEGAIFIAGAAVQWLRDGLKVVKNAADTGALAKLADKNQSVYLVPAFVGLGAPYWNAEVRGALFGLTRATTNKELARAALEAVCYQTNDLLKAMKKDWGTTGETILRVDGGMTASDFTMQFLADILGAPVDRPVVLETTALGAAYLAGLHAGLLPSPEIFAKTWKRQKRFVPKMDAETRAQ